MDSENICKMKILWFNTVAPRYSDSSTCSYGSTGLFDTLHDALLEDDMSVELGLAFLFAEKAGKEQRGKVTYYPIHQKSKTSFQKILYYWKNYTKGSPEKLLSEMSLVINDFKPDVIQVFGIESPFACILGHTDIPVIVHFQGFLNPTYNAFYPQGMNRFTFLWKTFSLNEWIFRNGYNFAADYMRYLCKTERDYFHNLQFALGRTEWDHQIARLLSPQSQYFYVGEMLRGEFTQSRAWVMPSQGKFVLISTISQTVYKGLDVILKTAKLLQEFTDMDFEWRIIGISAGSKFVKFFEKHCNIKSSKVNVRYEGVCNAAQICSLLLESHVYVHPSYIDNSPNSLCEAQLLGLPVIGTFVGGIPSLVTHQETGLLVPANAPYELGYWLQYLYHHPETMARLGDAARKTALIRHSKEKIVSDVLHVYHKISQQ
jgi:glycosyltransferase involved in cell wall biosynthesis